MHQNLSDSPLTTRQNDLVDESIDTTKSIEHRHTHDENIHQTENFPIPTKEELVQKYVIEGRTPASIARDYCSSDVVRDWLRQYGIIKARDPRPAKTELEQKYTVDRRSAESLGREYERSGGCIAKWLREYGIPTRSRDTARPPKTELEQKYLIDRTPSSEIANDYNRSVVTIYNWLRQYEIPTREAGNHRGPYITAPPKEELEHKHNIEERTFTDIATDYECSARTVRRWFHNYGIRIHSGHRWKHNFTKQQLESLCQKGLSQAAMAEKLEIGLVELVDALHIHGLKTKRSPAYATRKTTVCIGPRKRTQSQ